VKWPIAKLLPAQLNLRRGGTTWDQTGTGPMIRKRLTKLLPDVDKLRQQKAFGVFGERLFHPALWHLNRRSVAGGLAVGLFCGLIPGPLQMAGAAVCALWLRINLPVALATTIYTNPFTIIPLYLVAYRIGLLVLPNGAAAVPPAPVLSANLGASVANITEWAGALGTPLLVGVPILAALLALIGYMVVRIGWGLYLRWEWHRRSRRGT
jgi:hypothetical protein